MEFTDYKGNYIGTLTWENGYFSFSGKADASAKEFFNGTLKQIIDEYMKNKQQCEGRV